MAPPRDPDLVRKLEDITRLVSDWVWETDRDRRLSYASPRIVDLAGLLPEQVLGSRLTDLGEFRDPNGPLIPVDWNRPFRDVPFQLEHRRDGRLRHMRVSGLPVHCCESGRLLGVRGIARDETEARAAAERLRRAKESAESANRAKSQFLAMISHELRTPLHIVIGFSELIQSQAAGPIRQSEYLDYATEIRTSGQHLNELLTSLLDLAKLDAGPPARPIESMDLTRVIVAVAEDHSARCRERNIAFQLKLPAAPLLADADARALRQILGSLLSNAVKFTPAGGSVSLAATASEDFVVFKIRDTGIGIPSDQLERLFRPFEQAETDYRRTGNGLGLGLALVKGLVSLHGGTIEVESAAAKGTTVTVSLPRYHPDRGTAARSPDDAAEPATTSDRAAVPA